MIKMGRKKICETLATLIFWLVSCGVYLLLAMLHFFSVALIFQCAALVSLRFCGGAWCDTWAIVLTVSVPAASPLFSWPSVETSVLMWNIKMIRIQPQSQSFTLVHTFGSTGSVLHHLPHYYSDCTHEITTDTKSSSCTFSFTVKAHCLKTASVTKNFFILFDMFWGFKKFWKLILMYIHSNCAIKCDAENIFVHKDKKLFHSSIHLLPLICSWVKEGTDLERNQVLPLLNDTFQLFLVDSPRPEEKINHPSSNIWVFPTSVFQTWILH